MTNAHAQTQLLLAVLLTICTMFVDAADAAQLRAGAAKIDITNRDAPVNDPLHARVLVVSDGETTAVLIGLDVVSLGEIGYVSNEYLGEVRTQIKKDLGIPPTNVVINTSHCHGIPCADIGERTVEAVNEAAKNLVPVTVGVGIGHEDRIQENRRLKLKNGREVDVRHAYSLAPDEEIVGAGPIDPEIGVLRLDAEDGRTVAVVYNFACHPIQGAAAGGNTADITGFSSQVIEDNLSEGAIALFVQGCGGDINPAFYKDVHHPRDAEPLGNMLGLSTLKAVRKIKSKDDDRLKVINEIIAVPRADYAQRIIQMEAERDRLTESLGGTSLNLKNFMALAMKYNLASEFPTADALQYISEEAAGRDHLKKLDAGNRSNMRAYIRNIYTMEQLTRTNTNLRLLRRHQERMIESGKRTIDVEVVGLRIGDFVLTTFPGELTVQIGLGIKKRSPHKPTFVAGYTNGYIYYCPTAEQMKNTGGAQEDSDCLLAPEWQKIFEDKAAEILGKL